MADQQVAHTTMGGMIRRKPKTHRSKIALRKVLPKITENAKTALFLRGEKCSQVVQQVMTDLYMLKKPFAHKLTKKNPFRPFESTQHLEFLAFKNDASMFVFGSHSPKRPHNLILGRHFDYQLLDMVELGVAKFEPMRGSLLRIAPGSKPMLLFHGEQFNSIPTLQRVQNLLVDFFRGKVVSTLQLAGLDHVIQVVCHPTDPNKEITVSEDGNTVENASILIKHYSVSLKRSNDKVPRVELIDAGPTIDFNVRRTQLANPQAFKAACKLPKETVAKRRKEKNVTTNELGEKVGQVFLEGQTKKLDTMGTRKFKAFKKKRVAAAMAAEGDNEERRAPVKRPADNKDELGPAVLTKKKKVKKA